MIALEKTVCLGLRKYDFLDELREEPEIALEMLRAQPELDTLVIAVGSQSNDFGTPGVNGGYSRSGRFTCSGMLMSRTRFTGPATE